MFECILQAQLIHNKDINTVIKDILNISKDIENIEIRKKTNKYQLLCINKDKTRRIQVLKTLSDVTLYLKQYLAFIS